MRHPDFCIAGAGIIGLSLALELHHRGAAVTVLEQAEPLTQASTAAAGMLAARDPDNPPQLQPLSNLSIALYPNYLTTIERLSGIPVPFQTNLTLQSLRAASSTTPSLSEAAAKHLLPQLHPQGHRFLRLDEHSIDPRQLAPALLAAVRATSIDLRTHTPLRLLRSTNSPIEVHTPTGHIHAGSFIDCTGAWATTLLSLPYLRVVPRKGQMLAVELPPSLPLDLVVRTTDIYIVPRTHGPNAGRAIIGATVEDAGFDKTVHPADITALHTAASQLLPPLASATILESWAGLRPATPDLLPLLGPVPTRSNHFLATGHYRNGILLAPATAHVMAQLLTGEQPSVDLAPFSPARALPALHLEPSIAH